MQLQCLILLQGCGYYKKKSLKIHQKWHHMCLTLKTDYLNSDEVSITTKMYLDGRLVTGGKQVDFWTIMNKSRHVDKVLKKCLSSGIINTQL